MALLISTRLHNPNYTQKRWTYLHSAARLGPWLPGRGLELLPWRRLKLLLLELLPWRWLKLLRHWGLMPCWKWLKLLRHGGLMEMLLLHWGLLELLLRRLELHVLRLPLSYYLCRLHRSSQDCHAGRRDGGVTRGSGIGNR